MLGVETKPNDSERFKAENHEKALNKLGYRNFFNSTLAGGLNPNLGASLGAGFPPINDRSPRETLMNNNLSLGSERAERSSYYAWPTSEEKEAALEGMRSSLLYDIASLILFKRQALPIRLKIALDKLFSTLSREEISHVLQHVGWTYEDYSRGYMLQDHHGSSLHRWNMVTPEEETCLLQKFLCFQETKPIVQQLLQYEPFLGRSSRSPKDLRIPSDIDLKELKEKRGYGKEFREKKDISWDRKESLKDYKDYRDARSPRDMREDRRDDAVHFQSPLQSFHPNQHLLPQHADPLKNSEELKKYIERSIHFYPFIRGAADPSALLRPSALTNGPPTALPPHHMSLASSILSTNPSLMNSLFANSQLASSLSMLRPLIPPAVSVSNISPSTGGMIGPLQGQTSPLGSSPLNRLQNMQPFDFRKERKTPSPNLRTSISEIPSSMGAVSATSPGSVTSAGSAADNLSPSSNMSSLVPTTQPVPPLSVSLSSSGDAGGDHITDEDEGMQGGINNVLNLSSSSSVNTSPSTTPSVVAVSGSGGISLSPKASAASAANAATTPPKRPWNPFNMGTCLINPATGKKRVQCNSCLKTFCDKGALKIHFSAVHLREMHKCTVEGCNMMFSSRRSRNRHSANPNPKLHTPHVRRKISPHDGRTSHPHPVMLSHGFQAMSQGLQPTGFPHLGTFTSQFGGINPLTGLPFLPSGAPSEMHKQALDFQRQNIEMQSSSKSSLDLSVHDRMSDDSGAVNNWPYNHGSIRIGGTFQNSGEKCEHLIMNMEHTDMKRLKLEDDHEGCSAQEYADDDNGNDDLHSLKGEKGENNACSPSTNKRKRKSQHPTKFAFRMEDDEFISTDDDEDYDDNDDDFDDIDAKDSEDDKNEDKELDAMSDDDEDGCIEIKKPNDPKEEENEMNKIKSPSSLSDSVNSSNALRHLEDLSKGKFSHISEITSHPNGIRSLGIPSTAGNEECCLSPRPSDRDSDRDSNPGSPSEDSDGSLQCLENGFLTNIDVPIDKENPRRCIECGKTFQNHFGVKIHYQNVHLKLMHRCTVEGCIAAFPSKRSRDRHASNLNLHRKLLSTSSESVSGLFPGLSFPGLPYNSGLHPELINQIYSDASVLPTRLDNPNISQSLYDPDGPFGSDAERQSKNNLLSPSGITPFFLQNLLPHLTGNNSATVQHTTPSPKSRSTSPSLELLQHQPPTSKNADTNVESPCPLKLDNNNELLKNNNEDKTWVYNLEDDLPSPDREGKMPCKFCSKTFNDGEGLKEHYEEVHLSDLFRCTISGCPKIFSSRRKRNSHALNEAAHKDIKNDKDSET